MQTEPLDSNNIDLQNEPQPSVSVNGRFKNPWPTWKKLTLSNVISFILKKNHNSLDPPDILEEKLPIQKPNWGVPDNGVNVTWIGHASVAVQFDQTTILTDPIFSERCSPTSFSGPKRYRPTPCTVDELPKVDAVVISHSHYDHLDLSTVKQLNQRFGSELHWFVPKGLKSWFTSLNCTKVTELDWWEAGTIPGHNGMQFVFTPTQHWCKRTLTDTNKVLWGSWSIIGPKHKFYFAGDTGYCEGFKQIGEKYGPFDVSAIPIGAYEPRHFMHPQHVNPEEAVLIHQDVKSKASVGIHWGTFVLSHEHYLDPPKHLKESLNQKNIPEEEFVTLKHGESKVFN